MSGKEYRVQVAKSSKKKAARAKHSKPKISAPAKSKKPVAKARPNAKPKFTAKKPLVKAKASKPATKSVAVSKKQKVKAAAKFKVLKPARATAAKAPARKSPAIKMPAKAIASQANNSPHQNGVAAKGVATKGVATKSVPALAPQLKTAPVVRSVRPAVPPPANKPEAFQPQPAVATNLKPRKNQIGLGVRELEHFADLLLAKRRELVGDMSSMEGEALRTGGSSNLSNLPVHMADMGTDNYEQEFTLGLVEKDRNLLREINRALAKIQNGTYGICEGTGQAIGKPRLEVQPWARFSIDYARQREKNGMGVRTIG